MVSRQDLFLTIRGVVAKELKITNMETVQLASRFNEDLGMDSLSSLELMMGLEDKFELEIPDDAAEKLLTVEDVVNYLETKI